MEHRESSDGKGGRGLSTQDLLATEPRDERSGPESERAPAESPATDETPVDSAPGNGDRDDEAGPRLFAVAEVEQFRDKWQAIQIAFVDDPRNAVRDADELVAAVIQSLAATFAEHKSELESQWSQGEAATEDLRVALRQYRSFFNQLLSS